MLEVPSTGLAALIEEYGWRSLVHILTRQLGMRWKMSAVSSAGHTDSLWLAFEGLYRELNGKFREHKRRHGALDFEDLEEELLAWLGDASERRRLQDRYRHILVDEYQDISPPQYQLIKNLHRAGANRLVMVGDPFWRVGV